MKNQCAGKIWVKKKVAFAWCKYCMQLIIMEMEKQQSGGVME